jgi:hypothetical protein
MAGSAVSALSQRKYRMWPASMSAKPPLYRASANSMLLPAEAAATPSLVSRSRSSRRAMAARSPSRCGWGGYPRRSSVRAIADAWVPRGASFAAAPPPSR